MADGSQMGRTAWIQVGIATVTQNVATGLAFGSFGTIVLAIEQTYGASRSVSSLIISVMTASLLITASILGKLIDRISIRAVMACGALLGSLAFLLASVAHGAFELMAVYALLLGPATAFWGTLASMTLAGRWASSERRGLAMGLVNMPIVVMIAPLVIGPVLQQHGIRVVYEILGAIALAMLPLIVFVKDRPADPSLIRQPARPAQRPVPNPLLRDPVFWILIVATGLIVGTGTMKLAHFVPLMTEQGRSFSQANALLSIAGGAGVLGSFVFGTLADRIGGTRAMMCNAAIQAAMWCVFLAPVSYGVLLVDAVIVGACGGGIQGAFGVALAARFGQEAFGRAFGLASLFTLPFLFGLTPLAGLIHEATGTYRMPMAFMVGCLLLALALLGYLAGSDRSPRSLPR